MGNTRVWKHPGLASLNLWDPQKNQGSNNSGKIRALKKIFRANFVLQTCHPNTFTFKNGCVLFWYRDVFFIVVSRWPESPFWYRDLFFGIEILHSVVQHLDCLLTGIILCMLVGASASRKLEVKEDLDTEKKIEKSRYLKRDISIPTKRVTLKNEEKISGGKIYEKSSASKSKNPRKIPDSNLISRHLVKNCLTFFRPSPCTRTWSAREVP